MKKMIAVMLCLAMLLGCAAAVAESAEKTNMGVVSLNGMYELRGVLPEGFAIEAEDNDNGTLLFTIASEDPARPYLLLSVAFDEMYASVQRLNDLDDEAVAYIESTFTEEFDVDISYTETAYGTKLMVVKEKNGEFADVYTIFRGYEVEFVLVPSEAGGADSLSDEQIQLVIDFLSNMDFVEMK